jgi:hypothetical protein
VKIILALLVFAVVSAIVLAPQSSLAIRLICGGTVVAVAALMMLFGKFSGP